MFVALHPDYLVRLFQLKKQDLHHEVLALTTLFVEQAPAVQRCAALTVVVIAIIVIIVVCGRLHCGLLLLVHVGPRQHLFQLVLRI